MRSSPTRHPGTVHHLRPLLLVGGDFNVITVGALITVPEQQPEQTEEVKHHKRCCFEGESLHI